MNRRNFIAKSGLTLSGGFLAPYILPSGRLFAKSNPTKADHVVMVVLGGGVRQQESVLGRYLEESQGISGAAGNIMPNLFEGNAPEHKTEYGSTSISMSEVSQPITKLLNTSLEKTGLLFPEMRAQSVGHNEGMMSLLTGNHSAKLTSKMQPSHPTIFEYLRRHAGFKSTDTWFIGSRFGDSASFSHSSSHKDYGLNFRRINSVSKKQKVEPRAKLPGSQNPDSLNILYAADVLKEYKPKMLAVHLSGADICHSNFTGYLQSLHRSDYLTAWLWDYIQNNIPAMSGNTIFIVSPECGRNENPNSIVDQNDWLSYDHSDSNALRVWGLMAGKGVPNMRKGEEVQPVGRLTDIVPTIADIFGILDDVNKSQLIDPLARSLFQRV